MKTETLRQDLALTVWMTGLSGAGKSTLAERLQTLAQDRWGGFCVLDGDVLRTGLCRDLGFTAGDRCENIRRVAEVARLMNLAGLTVVCALISPFRADRLMALNIVGPSRFLDVHVDASLEVCERRDPKGLYRRARAGQIPHFTGIDSAYEAPLSPDLHLDTANVPLERCVLALADAVAQRRDELARAQRGN